MKRPDLLQDRLLSQEDQRLLNEILQDGPFTPGLAQTQEEPS